MKPEDIGRALATILIELDRAQSTELRSAVACIDYVVRLERDHALIEARIRELQLVEHPSRTRHAQRLEDLLQAIHQLQPAQRTEMSWGYRDECMGARSMKATAPQ